jgi:flagellin
MNLLTGAFAIDSANPITLDIQVGANMDQRERLYIGTMTAQALMGVPGSDIRANLISIETPDESNRTIGVIDVAMKAVSKQRADLGAYQNRFQMASSSVAIAAENLQAAESQIRDVDMASEIVDFTKNQILNQANIAMLAQANIQSQSVLQLLG